MAGVHAKYDWDTIVFPEPMFHCDDVKQNLGHAHQRGSHADWLLDSQAEGLAAINAISCNDVNTLFATGHEDWSVKVWDSRTCKVIGGVSDRYGHRGPVYGLCFKKGKQESILMTASRDRTVKMWSAEERVYIRTLYGHRSSVLAVDALAAERAVSVSDDKQPRMWKIDVDSTLGYGVSRCVQLARVSADWLTLPGCMSPISTANDH